MKRILLPVAAFGAVLALAAPAWAHVTVSAPGATRGGSDQEITFRVPVEKDADTVGVTVALPTDTPIASVDVRPVPGWTSSTRTVRLATPIRTDDGVITTAVSQVSWTARKGQGLAPGEYGRFTILAGQLPDVATLSFPTLQTYSDGSVVRWIEHAAPGSGADPADPAPQLTLAPSAAAAPAAAPGASGAPAGGSAGPAPAAASTVVRSPAQTAPTVLAVIALVVAAAALGTAVVGNARRRAATDRRSPS